jgi:hypothetical protein
VPAGCDQQVDRVQRGGADLDEHLVTGAVARLWPFPQLGRVPDRGDDGGFHGRSPQVAAGRPAAGRRHAPLSARGTGAGIGRVNESGSGAKIVQMDDIAALIASSAGR